MGDKSPSSGASGAGGRSKTMQKPKPLSDITVSADRDARAGISRIFGRDLDDQEIAMLVGGQEGGMFTVRSVGDEINIQQRHEHIDEQSRYIRKDRDGNISIYNSYFRAKENAPDGFGTKVFTDQVNGARSLGVKKIDVTAAGSKGSSMNGYYTWARMGYDGELGNYDLNNIPANIRKTMNGGRTIQDLYRTQEGRDYWKENGAGLSLSFDLDPNSISSRVNQAYNEERAKRKKG